MRLVSYNILDGGIGRADPLAETILAQRPDVVALVEADDLAVVQRIAHRLGFDFIHAEGKKHGAAILSRWEMQHTINHSILRPELHDCLLEAQVAIAGGSITVAAAHLKGRATEADEDVRMKEVAAILEIFAGHRQNHRPHLLVGDFNANAPVQKIDPRQCKQRTQEDWQANGGSIPRRAVQALLDAGYVDTLQAVHGEKAGEIGSFTTQQPGQRVDYVFAFGITRPQITDAWIEQDRLAKYASDHFPIGVEIALP